MSQSLTKCVTPLLENDTKNVLSSSILSGDTGILVVHLCLNTVEQCGALVWSPYVAPYGGVLVRWGFHPSQ